MPSEPADQGLDYGGQPQPNPDPGGRGTGDGSLQIAVLDFEIDNLNDPDVMAKYARADVVISDAGRFWGSESHAGDIDLLRAANPDIKVLGFFRSKCVRLDWQTVSQEVDPIRRGLFDASLPYWSYTTTGDTLQDWPGVALYNFTDPDARRAMLDVFVECQNRSPNKLDGVYWDYFNFSLWISPDVNTMEGSPDMDGDGVPHWDDADELQAFQDAEVAWIQEMRTAMGEDFIQIVNGTRALRDSTFAGLVDGMFYEIFPNVGFYGEERYRETLNLDLSYNLFAARNWPRTQNGGPWLILSNKYASYQYRDDDGQYRILDYGDLNRAVALLVDGTAIHYDLSGRHRAGIPTVELALGEPLGPTSINGDFYRRDFQNGYIELEMGSGSVTNPFSFQIVQDEQIVQVFDLPYVFP